MMNNEVELLTYNTGCIIHMGPGSVLFAKAGPLQLAARSLCTACLTAFVNKPWQEHGGGIDFNEHLQLAVNQYSPLLE